MVSRKRGEIVFLEKVVNTHAQKFRHQTNMVSVIEPAQKMDTIAEKFASVIESRLLRIVENLLSVCRIALSEFLKYPYFNLACVPIFWNSTNDLNGHPVIGLRVDGLNDFAKGSLAQQPDCAIFDKLRLEMQGKKSENQTYNGDESCHLVR